EVVALMEPNFRHPSTTPSPSLSIPIDAYGSRVSKLNLLVMVATVSPPSLQTLIVHQLPDHFPAHRLRIGAGSVDVDRGIEDPSPGQIRSACCARLCRSRRLCHLIRCPSYSIH